jgi:RimJ/RimL family protein N-acetyltransferase
MGLRNSRAVAALATERLTLRPHTVADFADSAAMWGDPHVVRLFLDGQPRPPEEVWLRLLRNAGLWALLGFGYWVVRTHAGRFVGEIGLGDFHRTMEPGFGGVPEAGWALAPWAHGQGYASEALAAVLAWTDAQQAHPRTACMIMPDNEASLRLARRHGYAEFGQSEYKGRPVLLLERYAARDAA